MVAGDISNDDLSEFSNDSVRRILMRQGAEKLTKEAETQFIATLNFIAKEIAHNAVKFAMDGGKTTVTAENIRDATTWFLERGGITDGGHMDTPSRKLE